MDTSLLMPPIAFVIVLAAVGVLSFGMSRLALTNHKKDGLQPYACGEDVPDHMIQPNYGEFLPFAVFFTLLHVTVLVVATVPAVSLTALFMATVYVLGAVVGLSVLYRK